MRFLTAVAIPILVLTSTCTAMALDCARVRSLNAEGKRASDIARELSITTPDVQACLAGEVDEAPAPRVKHPAGSLIAPTLPSSDSPIPQPPNQ
jgi:hypothetical protein